MYDDSNNEMITKSKIKGIFAEKNCTTLSVRLLCSARRPVTAWKLFITLGVSCLRDSGWGRTHSERDSCG